VTTKNIDSGAIISYCRLYRYQLWRTWDPHLPRCAFVMLNPSTADAHDDDPTIRRCVGFAKSWGFGGIFVVNVFAFRATKPADLRKAADPVGPHNGKALVTVARACSRVVVAWGAACRWRGRPLSDRQALTIIRGCQVGEPVLCLGKTKAGFPRHPLYVKGNTVPLEYGEAPR